MDAEFSKKCDFFIGIDSDGCAFDTMELKHKECFAPMTIYHWNFQCISKYAREAFEFVNLYSKNRGVNRFPALIEVFRLLQHRPEVLARGVHVEIPQDLVTWIESETKLGNAALERAVAQTDNPVLKKTYAWSVDINKMVDKIVGEGVPPFPMVRESLQRLQDKADMVVVSATPQEALMREWDKQGILQYVRTVCGQEIGTKKESLRLAEQYSPDHSLMIGDAPGDYKAALANKTLFFPINPGEEEASWQRFYDEGIDRFLNLEFAGEYQKQLLDEFDSHLPVNPPWKQV
ncbi:MAG: HAD family hydrolase [Thermoguttaceae bacterium]|nr:HAD family hydrolase [Thermoguttaceae bacterium]